MIYLHIPGQNCGPYTEDLLQQMLRDGIIGENIMSCMSGSKEWIRLGDLLNSADNEVLTITDDQVELTEDDKIFYKGKPFTGRVICLRKGNKGVVREGGGFKICSSESSYKDGKKEAETLWHGNGKKAEEAKYKNGKLNGLRTGWYENGQKSCETFFTDDKRMSQITWKPDGEECTVTDLNNGKGIVCYYDDSGEKSEQVNYEDGYKNGVRLLLASGQPAAEENYKDDKLDGLQIAWNDFEDGRKYLETNWKDGKRHGLETEWYKNGQKAGEGNFKDGKEDGLFRSWYENGQKKREVNNKDGLKDGLSTLWYENGQKSEERTYKDGREDGCWLGWYENGQKEKKMNFKASKLMSMEVWKPNGEKCPVTNIDEDGNGVWVVYNGDGTELTRYTFEDGE